MRASFPDMPTAPWPTRVRRRLLTALLHLAQPLARLRGRLHEGLTPWRRRGTPGPTPLWPVTASIWTGHVQEQDQRLRAMEAGLRAEGACVLRGGRHDPWDLEVRGGFFGAARLVLGAEDHPGGHQMVRLRWWPDVPVRGPILTLMFALLSYSAAHDRAWVAAAVLGLGAGFFAWRTLEQCTAAMSTVQNAVARVHGEHI
jgi:O-antigen biosynthesis protein